MSSITKTMGMLYVQDNTLLDSAQNQLTELVKAVDSTGKPGTLTITIKVRKATAGSLAVTSKVEVKTPPAPPVETLLFPTVEGDLLTEDPNQRKLPLQAVETPTRELRSMTN